ncbi:hypothetical protein RD792_016513 [Penstemon davidsonii]|uniref:NAC domain-containing protein n=1 Tax=Penstemon davidsonii TaxID=160366 RepID=A0ABR0CL98_9LAMI|nr:hypothetical protein RD792_016513 [Penstemon davidsonii]
MERKCSSSCCSRRKYVSTPQPQPQQVTPKKEEATADLKKPQTNTICSNADEKKEPVVVVKKEPVKGKVYNLPLPTNLILEHDAVFDSSPSDLPGDPKEKRYFFTQRKINNTTKIRRLSSGYGYWKATGKDKQILVSGTDLVVGIKKTLVFYDGRGSKTEWIMDELSLVGSITAPYLPKEQMVQVGDWVVCRLYQSCRENSDEMEFAYAQDALSSPRSSGSTEVSSVNPFDDEVASNVILDDGNDKVASNV